MGNPESEGRRMKFTEFITLEEYTRWVTTIPTPEQMQEEFQPAVAKVTPFAEIMYTRIVAAALPGQPKPDFLTIVYVLTMMEIFTSRRDKEAIQ